MKSFSRILCEAEAKRVGASPLTELSPNLSVSEAYHVQLETIEAKVRAGDRVVGKKIGLTSKAMQSLFGINEPDYGHLLKSMKLFNGTSIQTFEVMQPKVEGEIAFILQDDLYGSKITVDDVMNATQFIIPAIEIVDSRIAEWKIKLADTIADNASSGLFLLGDNLFDPSTISLPEITLQVRKNGTLVSKGKGSDVLGNPASCVAWLAERMSEHGTGLKAGEIILSGALCEAVNAYTGDRFEADFGKLGKVYTHFDE